MFYLDDNVINDVLSLINKNIYQVENMSDGYLGKMAPLSNSGMYGNGVEVINSQMNAIKDGYINFRNITQNNLNSIINMENEMTQMAKDISLPKNFNADDTGLSVSVSNSVLSKEDGRSVNEGIKDIKEDVMTDYYDGKEEKLFKLKNIELTEDTLKDYQKTEHNDLHNINNDNEVREEKLEDFEKTKENVLYDISNSRVGNISDLDDYKYITKEKIENINNVNNLNKQNIDDSYDNTKSLVDLINKE